MGRVSAFRCAGAPVEWVAERWRDRWPQGPWAAILEWARATETGAPFSAEYRLRTTAGEWLWVRDEANPVGGWYGMKKGLRGRFGVYMPPLLEALGLAELTHDAKNNKMRAK